ncbi:MAG: hypothetical protein ACTHMG_00315 [Sphingomonas sp.]
MRPWLMVAFVTATVALADPAAAGQWSNINSAPSGAAPASLDAVRRVDRIDAAIRDGRDRGQLSRREARRLHRDGELIDSAAQRYDADGASQTEQNEIDTRIDVLEHQVFLHRLEQPAGEKR